MKEVWSWISTHYIQTVALLSIFIQIVPVKVYPITWLLKWIGKTINAPVMKELEAVKKEQKNQGDRQDENEKDRIRWEVLSFASSCRNGRKHSKEEFVHIISLNDKYTKLLEKTGDRNGVFEEDYAYIKTLYSERLVKNDFLV